MNRRVGSKLYRVTFLENVWMGFSSTPPPKKNKTKYFELKTVKFFFSTDFYYHVNKKK